MTEIQDPIAFELFKNSIFSIADEMALTICRTTYSSVLRDNMDFSTAFADTNGKLVAQGLTLPAHLGSIPDRAGCGRRAFRRGEMKPGDMYIMNDPFDGGMHLPDIFIFKPIFVDGPSGSPSPPRSAITPMSAAGSPGSNACDSTEIYQEGLRIPPLKLYDRRQAQRHDLVDHRERTCAFRCKVLGDLRAQLAACTHRGNGSSSNWSREYGEETVEASTWRRLSTTPNA